MPNTSFGFHVMEGNFETDVKEDNLKSRTTRPAQERNGNATPTESVGVVKGKKNDADKTDDAKPPKSC